ncbi:MAG: NAD+ synthase, partial [Gammaproteobacteria bacterium]
MNNHVRIVLGQLNFLVGGLEENTQKILKSIQHAQHELEGDVLIFPELALTGYCPEDFLFRHEFHTQISKFLEIIALHTQGMTVIVGVPKEGHNTAVVFQNGKIIAQYHKQALPNFGVFDEKRYFSPGSHSCVITVKNVQLGILICQDIWHPAPMAASVHAGAQAIICLNASPFQINKHHDRVAVLQQRIAENSIPVFYANLVGTQDELVFDGGSMALNAHGEIIAHADYFEERLLPVDFPFLPSQKGGGNKLADDNKEALAYQALVMGVRDYAHKNKFSDALLGLSGGLDSALTLAIAVDALGKEHIHAVIMPSRYTSALSLDMAESQADNMGVKSSIISIEPIFENFLAGLAPEFTGTKPDITEENLQARCRGTLLMALSNKRGGLVLTTGNKSEFAVGYSTLYGDMAGGFAVLKDVWKTLVFDL